MTLRISRSNRRLRLESLESRRLLASDLAVPDFGTLATPSFSPAIVSATSTSEMAEGEMTMQSMDMGHSMFEVTPDAVVTMHDSIPRFGANPTFISISDGNWSDPSIWQAGQVPGVNAIVSIPAGRTVTYDVHSTMRLDAIEVSGQLKFATDSDTSVWLNEIMVMPAGTLTIGTAAEPVNAGVTAEIVFTDTPQADGHHFKTGTVEHPGIDPSQWGNGLIVLGKAEMHGHILQNTFTRAAGDVLAQSTTIDMQGYVGDWQIGDKIVIPDTRQTNPVDTPNYYTYESQEETATIVAVTANSIVLDHPLQFDHVGPRDADGTPTQTTGGVTLAPHIANLGRNIVLRSENPDGVRGHVAFVGDASKDIRYVAYEDLGRTDIGPLDNTAYDANGQVTHIGTNQIARYSDHNHHLSGPMGGIPLDAAHPDTGVRYQSIDIGNSIDGALKWGTVIHASHFGLTADSVYHDIKGAGVATEDGSEYGNTITGNFVVGVHDGETGFNGLGENLSDRGDQGDGFWFAGPMNTVTDNVVANAVRNGFVVFPDDIPNTRNSSKYREVRVPLFAGANMHDESQTRLINVLAEPFDDFSGNEIYGATTGAVQLWSVGNRNYFPDAPSRNTLVDTTVWHVTGVGIRFYYAADYLIDGWLQRGDPAMIQRDVRDGGPSNPSSNAAISHAGSQAFRSEVRHADIQNMTIGYLNRGRGYADDIKLIDSYLDNHQNIVVLAFSQIPLDGTRDFLVEDVTFGNQTNPGATNTIEMQWNPARASGGIVPDVVFIEDFAGNPGIDLQVFYAEQAPDFVMPSVNGEDTCPGGELTNEQCYANYGIAVAGSVAPTKALDGDDGALALARGKALGMDGLVFEQSPTGSPRLFASVQTEYGRPTLFYTVLGNTDGVQQVSFDIDGVQQSVLATTGKIDLTSLNATGTFAVSGQLVDQANQLTPAGNWQTTLTLPLRTKPTRYPSENVNHNPVIDAVNDQIVTARSLLEIKFSASDPDDDSVVFSGVNLPSGASITPSGIFSWTPTNAQTGTYTLGVTAFDDRGGSVTARFDVEVVFDASDSPLVGYWQLSSIGASNEVADQSIYDHSAYVEGASQVSGGVSFQNRGDIVTAESSYAYRPEHAVTIAATVQPDGRSNHFAPLIQYDSGSVSAYSLQVKDHGSMGDQRGLLQGYWFSVRTETGTHQVSYRRTSWDGVSWDQVVGVYDGTRDGGRIEIYVNGNMEDSKTGVGERIVYPSYGAQTITIGGRTYPMSSLVGNISEAMVWASANATPYTDPLTMLLPMTQEQPGTILQANIASQEFIPAVESTNLSDAIVENRQPEADSVLLPSQAEERVPTRTQ